MDKRMEKIREEYREPEMSRKQVEEMKNQMHKAKVEQEKQNKVVMWRRCASVAAGLALALIIVPNTSANAAYAMSRIPVLGDFVKVVTFRDYHYEDERNMADVDVPELVMEEIKDDSVNKGVAGEAMIEEESAAQKEETLQKSMDEINEEIQAITEPFIETFKESLVYEDGYQNITVKSEVINTTQDYFTLKLICYMASGSGAEWNYYYTIDLATGERLLIKDIFEEGADYVTPISENIKAQMKQQMEEDDMKTYWLDQEVEEWNFKAISEDQTFYINENGNLVISFNEGDVAPMYMGVVEFEIPNSLIADIRVR